MLTWSWILLPDTSIGAVVMAVPSARPGCPNTLPRKDPMLSPSTISSHCSSTGGFMRKEAFNRRVGAGVSRAYHIPGIRHLAIHWSNGIVPGCSLANTRIHTFAPCSRLASWVNGEKTPSKIYPGRAQIYHRGSIFLEKYFWPTRAGSSAEQLSNTNHCIVTSACLRRIWLGWVSCRLFPT